MTIRVHSASHANVGSVTVAGSWSDGTTGGATCRTNSSGTCTLQKTGIAHTVTSVTFTVTALTHATLSYQPAANHDPDRDSTGTVIVIPHP